MLFGRKKKKKEEKDTELEEEQKTVPTIDLLSSLQKGPEQRSIMFVGEVNEERRPPIWYRPFLFCLKKKKKGKKEVKT